MFQNGMSVELIGVVIPELEELSLSIQQEYEYEEDGISFFDPERFAEDQNAKLATKTEFSVGCHIVLLIPMRYRTDSNMASNAYSQYHNLWYNDKVIGIRFVSMNRKANKLNNSGILCDVVIFSIPNVTERNTFFTYYKGDLEKQHIIYMYDSFAIYNQKVKIGDITRDATQGQLAIAAPYQAENSSLPDFMAQLPDVLRNHILFFLRSPLDVKKRVFPLILRQLQLPPFIVDQAMVQLDSMSPEDVVDRVVSLSPVVRSPLLLEYNPCPPDKELNPKTKRCIKKCKSDQVRNDKGRCVRTSKKKCPKGQVRDRVTKECRDDKRISKRVSRVRSPLIPIARPLSNTPLFGSHQVCVMFRVSHYDEKEDGEKVVANQLSEFAKVDLVDSVKVQFVQDMESLSDYSVRDIKMEFLPSDIIRVTGTVQHDPQQPRYGATFNQWVQFINEKMLYGYRYGPHKNLFTYSNGKNVSLRNVYPCR